ncbi:MAG: carboxypeptidase regulatory-like domain-containing protein [Verrucomicrobiae bacterium]|nr:carboxypeptidase regulatory-like domain-containing protein [Verrucomicrobiae bacterium]
MTGTVLESKLNHPLTNAAVRLENMPFGTNTLNDGTFRLSNIPVGKGYVLDVSAAGYASRRLVSVNVPVGTNNLGNIILTNMSGPYRLVPLVPDINPSVTTVEQGGTAYRYYVVLNASNAPQGGISVSAQVAGGSVMVQTNDISDYWPGRIAGISDPQDGVVRISITNSILSQNGAVQSIQLSISNVVQQTFQAQAVPRQYDQIWKQTVGGGVGGDIYKIVSGEIDTSAESELRHTIVGGINTSESISRSREAKFAVGVGIPGIDVGASLKTSNINVQGGGGLSAGGDGFLAIILNSQFFFDPNTVDANQNLMKLYVDLGNVLTGTPIGNRLYTVIDQIVAPVILVSGTNLNSIECDVQAGAEAQGQVGLAIANNQKTHVIPIAPYVNISGDLEIKAIYGYKAVFGKDANAASIAGWERSGSGSFSSVFSDQLYSLGRGYEQDQLDWILANQSSFEQPLSIAKVDANAGTANSSSSWKQYDPAELNASYAREFTELLVASNDGSLTNYERLIFASAVGTQAGFNLDFGPKISFNLELDRGAEIVNERGAFLSRNQSKYWPTESYPPITTNLFPTQSWSSILGQWGNNATAPIGQAVNQAVTVIQNAGNTIVKAGQATLNIVGGALSSGSKVISSWVSSWFAGHKPAVAYGLKPNGGAASASYLPADGATNYVYGIDGVYQFSSTNPFSGTATLVIPFNSADVVGLNPADLRIYQLPDGSNRWQLVGGIVDTVSNTVTATITNLGTFALAPPLPTGDLQLILSTNALPADGVSTLAVNVTNILLNTGLVATQQWLFTATVVGAQLLNPDCDTNLPGIQVMSTNGAITLLLQAPSGGTVANMALASVAGDAYGSTAINIIDTTPPATPANVALIAGQSRIWVSWRTNSEADLAGYRVYYSAFTAGPPWTGTAAIEGTPSPVQVTGTNCLLRGLSLGTNYYIAVSAVDSSGNESPLSTPVHVTTIQSAPAAPTGVTARFGNDGTNLLMWALSEDDGYNDRDVSQYYIWRAILPGGSYVKIGQVAAGTGLYCTTNLPLPSAQYLDYEVSVVDSSSLTSTSPSATDIMPVGMSIIAPKILNKQFQLTLTNGVLNQTYILWSSTNLVNWTPVVTNLYTNSSVIFYDVKSTNYSRRFYKIGY